MSSAHTCFQCGKEGDKRCSGCKQATYCSTKCQRKHWKEGKHKHQCGAHFQLLQSSVSRATVYGTSQSAFQLRLTADRGRDITAAVPLPAGTVIACPLMYECVIENIIEQADVFARLLRHWTQYEELLRAVCNGIPFTLNSNITRNVQKACVKQGATPADLRLVEPVLTTLMNMSYSIRCPIGNLSSVQHALMFVNHSNTPNVVLKYVGGEFGFMLLVARDIPVGTSVRSCYYTSSLDAHEMMTLMHPSIPLSEAEQRMLVPNRCETMIWNVLSSPEAPASAAHAYLWSRINRPEEQTVDLPTSVSWEELMLLIHALVQLIGSQHGLDVFVLFAEPDHFLLFRTLLRQHGAPRIQQVLVDLLMHAKSLLDPHVIVPHIVSTARQTHASITCVDAFWETLGMTDVLLSYKDLARRLKEQGHDAVHVEAVYDADALERESYYS